MKAIKIFRVALLGSVALFLGSCAEEVEVEKSQEGEQVNISISVHQDWDDDEATRAARMSKSDFAGPREAILFDGTIGDQPVYLWCDEFDGIDDSFSPLTAEAPELDDETRGTLMTATGTGAASDDMTMFHRDFSIWPSTGGVHAIFPDRTKAERPWSSNHWRVNNPITWPASSYSGYYTYLYAFAPYDAVDTKLTTQYFYYETPEKAVNQPDLMMGYAIAYKKNKEIVFDFRHALSAIKFKMGSKGFAGGYTIKNIALRGLGTEGEVMRSGDEPYWNDAYTTNKRNITLNQDFNFPITSSTYNTMITNDGDAATTGTTFLVIPQNPNHRDASVAIKLQDASGQEKTITANLPSREWEPGYTYTYTIASEIDNSDFWLSVDGELVFDYKGEYVGGGVNGGPYYSVLSYRKTSSNYYKPVAWEIVKYEVSDDGGRTWVDNGTTKPAWLTGLSLESGEGTDHRLAKEYGEVTGLNSSDYIVDKNTERNTKLHSKDNTPVSDYDLSEHDIKGNPTSRNTANCYVISAPGTYKIPLVYGNAIKNDQPNPAAYTSAVTANLIAPGSYSAKTTYTWRNGVRVSESVVLTSQNVRTTYTKMHNEDVFLDYKGGKIRNPWLTVNKANDEDGNKGIPSSAVVVWTDGSSDGLRNGPDIVTNPGISSDLKYLTFKVEKENLRQGNVEIAVLDEEGNGMWRWHLWFAPDDVLDTTNHTNAEGISYRVPKETLGFTVKEWTQTTYTAERKVRVTVQQKEGDSGGTPKTGTFTITQTPGVEQNAYATYYQFGRQDPIPYNQSYSGMQWVILGGSGSIDGFLWNNRPAFFRQAQNRRIDHWHAGTYGTSNYSEWWYTPEDDYYYGWKAIGSITNLWAANADVDNPVTLQSNPSVKTVYDPCPVGFHVPEIDAFSGSPTFPYASFPNVGHIEGKTQQSQYGAEIMTNVTPTGAVAYSGVGGDYNYLLNYIHDSWYEETFNYSSLTHLRFTYGYGRTVSVSADENNVIVSLSATPSMPTYQAYPVHPIAD